MKLNDLPGVARKRLQGMKQNPAWLATQTGISRALIYAAISNKVRNPKTLSWENWEKVFAALGQELSIEVTEKKGGPRTRPTPEAPDMPV